MEEPALRSYVTPEGVGIRILLEGDGRTFPRASARAHLLGRLPCGSAFTGTAAYGKAPVELQLGRHPPQCLPGIDFAVRTLSLGTRAEVMVPAHLGHPGGFEDLIPPGSVLAFDVEVLAADGVEVPTPLPPRPRPPLPNRTAAGRLVLPQWVSRVKLPPPAANYLSFCRCLARQRAGGPGVEALGAPDCWPVGEVPRGEAGLAGRWDGSSGPLVVRGLQGSWEAFAGWDLEWFRQNLGHERQLAKWMGPLFIKQETALTMPVFEMSVAEYVDYVEAIEAVDPQCSEALAAACPRLYLNGWPCFRDIPRTREFVRSSPPWIEDLSRATLERYEEMLGEILPMRPQRTTDELDWELQKLFLSPRGAITRLHFDNAGAHGWLAQVRGRKLFVLFAPEDGKYLHAFDSNGNGVKNGSLVDPLDAEVHRKWPGSDKARPLVTVLDEGEAILIPKGWWHYAVSLDTSITVMRNFWSETNRDSLFASKDCDHTPEVAACLQQGGGPPQFIGISNEEARTAAQ